MGMSRAEVDELAADIKDLITTEIHSVNGGTTLDLIAEGSPSPATTSGVDPESVYDQLNNANDQDIKNVILEMDAINATQIIGTRPGKRPNY